MSVSDIPGLVIGSGALCPKQVPSALQKKNVEKA